MDTILHKNVCSAPPPDRLQSSFSVTECVPSSANTPTSSCPAPEAAKTVDNLPPVGSSLLARKRKRSEAPEWVLNYQEELREERKREREERKNEREEERNERRREREAEREERRQERLEEKAELEETKEIEKMKISAINELTKAFLRSMEKKV